MGDEACLLTAIAAATAPLDDDPEVPSLHVALAGAYAGQGELAAAEAQLFAALERSAPRRRGRTLAESARCRLKHGLPQGRAELCASLEAFLSERATAPAELARGLRAWFCAAALCPAESVGRQCLEAWGVVRLRLDADRQMRLLEACAPALRSVGLAHEAQALGHAVLGVDGGALDLYERATTGLGELGAGVLSTDSAGRFLERVSRKLAEVQEWTIAPLRLALARADDGAAEQLIARFAGAGLGFGACCVRVAQVQARVDAGHASEELLDQAWGAARQLEGEAADASRMRLLIRLLPLARSEPQRERLAGELLEDARGAAEVYLVNEYLLCLARCAPRADEVGRLIELARARLADERAGWLLWEALAGCMHALGRLADRERTQDLAEVLRAAARAMALLRADQRPSRAFFVIRGLCAALDVLSQQGQGCEAERALILERLEDLQGYDFSDALELLGKTPSFLAHREAIGRLVALAEAKAASASAYLPLLGDPSS